MSGWGAGKDYFSKNHTEYPDDSAASSRHENAVQRGRMRVASATDALDRLRVGLEFIRKTTGAHDAAANHVREELG